MVNSISLGALYSLLAIGYTMVYGIIKSINFAHGEIFMCGAFFTWWIMTDFSIPFPIAALMGIMLSTLLGIGVERIAIGLSTIGPYHPSAAGALGDNQFDGNGDSKRDMLMYVVKGGVAVFYE